MEKIKKHDNLLLWIGIAIFSALSIFQVKISVGDELWNFQNIYKMIQGFMIYQDSNVIITPIFFWIGEIILKIFGANYFIYRLFDVCIYTSMIFMVYIILKQVKIEKTYALLYTLIIHYFAYLCITGGANYNILAVVFVLLGTYISLKYDFDKKPFIIGNGIIIYLVLFTKQNIGVYYLLGSILMQLLIGKNNKKTYIDLLKQTAVVATLSIITFGYFAYHGNILSFINYAFLGIGEFGTRNIAMEIECIVHLGIAIITVICAIYMQRKIANEEQKRIITIFLSIGIPMIAIIYPIINAFHTILAIVVLAILLMYLVDIVLKQELTKKMAHYIILFIIIVLTILGIKAGIVIIKNNPFTTNYQNPYYGGILLKEMESKINCVNEYIQKNNEKVIIFSKEAALYNIPKKRSNGAMDLPFLGNLGYGGEDAMLEEIKNKKGYQILLTKENYWQESDKITDYIRGHYNKIGEIEEFEIYEIQ